MPGAAEMDIFYRKIGGDQLFETGLGPEDGAIVADAAEYGAVPARMGEATDGGN
jgi:hypothetical protein